MASNPSSVIGLELYDRTNTVDRPSGWVAVSYDNDDGGYWVQFEHSIFQPWDIKLDRLEIIINICTGKNYLREKS